MTIPPNDSSQILQDGLDLRWTAHIISIVNKIIETRPVSTWFLRLVGFLSSATQRKKKSKQDRISIMLARHIQREPKLLLFHHFYL
jgi:hypothetical protein